MTDKECLLDLGEYILNLQADIAALRGVFMEYRVSTPQGNREVPWRQDVERIRLEASAAHVREVSGELLRGSLEAAGSDAKGSTLIRALHRHFLDDK